MDNDLTTTFNLLLNYRQDASVKALQEFFNEKSFLEILHVDRKENYHSHFLKWIFEDNDTCLSANENLLILLIKRSGHQYRSFFPDHVKRSIIVGDFKIISVNVNLEEKLTDGRSDLVLDIQYKTNDIDQSHLHVVIENKIYSQEHNAGKSNMPQTKVYHQYYTQLYHDDLICVYLTPIDTPTLDSYTEAECDCKSFIQINYQDLLDSILLPLSHDESIQIRKRFIIEEYIKGLSINYSQNSSIMAMTNELRKLLEDFWNNNQELIELSIETLASSPLAGDEERDSFNKLSAEIKRLTGKGPGKDNTHYSINGTGDWGKGPLVYEIVRRYVEKKGLIDIEDLQRVFPYKWRGKRETLGNMIVIDSAQFDREVKGNPSRDWRWKKLEKDDKICFVNNQWGDKKAMAHLINQFKAIEELKDINIEELPSRSS